MIKITIAAAVAALTVATPALAQTIGESQTSDIREAEPGEPLRIRAGIGAKVVPSYPGASQVDVVPLWSLSITRGDQPFEFSAPDQSTGFAIIRTGGFQIGPAGTLEGSRRRKETGAGIDEVGTSLELGGFVQQWIGTSFRLRAEARKGVTGHRAWTGDLSADFVARDGDKYVFSIGPRLSLSDQKYQRTYFGVSPREALASGLPVYTPSGDGIHAYGAAASLLYQFDTRWGMYGYAKYDRLSEDAGRSPLITRVGKRDQLSGGLALTYTFNVRR